MSDGRLRLTILGGALGSGKTTWARHQLFAGAFGPRVHVLVNEAAEVPVDDQLLARADGVTVLAGGCACCDGRAALIAPLREVCDGANAVKTKGVSMAKFTEKEAALVEVRPRVFAAARPPPICFV